MHPTQPKSLGDYFTEGLKAREDGLTLNDNPYSAGSEKRREWNAGFCATVRTGDDDDLAPDDDPQARDAE